MKVVWMEQAEKALLRTAKLVQSEFGKKSSERLLRDTHRMGCLLAENPNLGHIEPLLANKPATYRSIVVNRLNKIVYRIVDDTIEIADFWEVRREPSTLANQVK